MNIKECYDVLGSWEWDVKQAAHDLVEALKPQRLPRNYTCEAIEHCKANCIECLFWWDDLVSNEEEEWMTK